MGGRGGGLKSGSQKWYRQAVCVCGGGGGGGGRGVGGGSTEAQIVQILLPPPLWQTLPTVTVPSMFHGCGIVFSRTNYNSLPLLPCPPRTPSTRAESSDPTYTNIPGQLVPLPLPGYCCCCLLLLLLAAAAAAADRWRCWNRSRGRLVCLHNAGVNARQTSL